MCDKSEVSRNSFTNKPQPLGTACEEAEAKSQIGGAASMNEDYVLDQLSRSHPAGVIELVKYENIRAAARNFAKVVLVNVPPGADRNAAIRHIRAAMMTADAGVALHGFSL